MIAGIRSRVIGPVNGLSMHVLEAGFENPDNPCVVLLHGFPELAYSWRKIMGPLAKAGYHVVAPDQRGCGRTTGWQADYDTDPAPFRFPNLVRDVLGLTWALGRSSIACVVGHDFGSPVAALCALIRPDIFESVVLMSAPFPGAPPVPLHSLAAEEFARLPRYYVMDLDRGMAETAAAAMPSKEVIERCDWLPEQELAVYSANYSRTGFQGGLNWYRCLSDRAAATLWTVPVTGFSRSNRGKWFVC